MTGPRVTGGSARYSNWAPPYFRGSFTSTCNRKSGVQVAGGSLHQTSEGGQIGQVDKRAFLNK